MTDDVPQVAHDTWKDIEEEPERRLVIIAPHDRESTAVVSVILPPGGMMELDPASWHFEGWLHDRTAASCTCGKEHLGLLLEEPKRFHGDADADG